MKRLHIFIYGHVQGVFFRAFIKENAEKLHIKGWVRNILEGSIEAVFEGYGKDMRKLLEECHKGPMGSKVNKVNIKDEELEYEEGFEVR